MMQFFSSGTYCQLFTPPSSCMKPHWFQCHNGQCIPYTFECDGEQDCLDGSDEQYCSGFTVSIARCSCELHFSSLASFVPSTIVPRSFFLQILKYLVSSCMNACGTSPNFLASFQFRNPFPLECAVDEYKCDNNDCIPLGKFCDTMIDCVDESDEYSNCTEKVSCAILSISSRIIKINRISQ